MTAIGAAVRAGHASSPGSNVDVWVVGVQILGISTLAAAVNFIRRAVVGRGAVRLAHHPPLEGAS